MNFHSNPFLSRLLILIFLISCGSHQIFGQEISNINVGFVPEINRLEVAFDLVAPENQNYNLQVFLNAFPRGIRKQVPQSSIYGISISGVKPGYHQYFQIDLKALKLPPHEYELEITFQGLKINKPLLNIDTASVSKKEEIKSKKESKLAFIPKEFSKIRIDSEDFDTDSKFISAGINPIDIGGQQTSKTFSLQFGYIKHRFGYAISFKYAISNTPSTNLVSNNSEIMNYPSNAFYRFNNQFSTNRLAVIPSFLFGIKKNLYLRGGIGYGMRNVFWGLDNYDNKWIKIGADWSKNSTLSQNGIELETGINLLFRRIQFSAGINYLGLLKSPDSKAFTDGWVGIGINF